MLGTTKLKITKASVLQAIQDYFDDQLAMKHTVTDFSQDTSTYGDATVFEVTLTSDEPALTPDKRDGDRNE